MILESFRETFDVSDVWISGYSDSEKPKDFDE